MISQGPQFVVSKPRTEAASRLFCFPHAGGGPVAFFEWPDRLGAGIECVAVQYPGRGQRLRERPLSRVEDLVADLSGRFADWDGKPFAFYGHSLGAIVAFELARRLARQGGPTPFHLFAGAARAPHLERPLPPICHLPDAEFVEAVQARYGGIPREIYADPDVLDIFLPALRADFAAYETYVYEPGDPLEMPISVFAGDQDEIVGLEALDPWAMHTAAGLEVTVVHAGHFFTGPTAVQLARELQLRLEAHPREPRLRCSH